MKKQKSMPGIVRKRAENQTANIIVPLYGVLYCVVFSISKNTAKLEKLWKWATKLIKGLEHNFYKKTKECGSFQFKDG